MSVTPHASMIAVNVKSGRQIPPTGSRLSKEVSFSPASFAETSGFFDSLSEQCPMAVPAGGFEERQMPRDSGIGRTLPGLRAASQTCFGPSSKPISQLPGTALLKDFEVLYQKHRRRVYRQCYRMLRNQEDAEDMTQEVFLQLFRKVHTFRGEANFSTWLHRLTFNTVLMQLRRSRRWREAIASFDTLPASEERSSDTPSVMTVLAAPAGNALDRIGLDLAIAELSSGYQQIFLLHDLEGYRHDEIAKRLGISEGTSKSQLHKARLRLRSLLGSASGKSRRSPAGRNRRRRACPSPSI
jgi:RNA polymerase sigma-70 factor, ECF subfamily